MNEKSGLASDLVWDRDRGKLVLEELRWSFASGRSGVCFKRDVTSSKSLDSPCSRLRLG